MQVAGDSSIIKHGAVATRQLMQGFLSVYVVLVGVSPVAQ